MVKLRLKRMGTIKKPFYRIVAVDSHKKRDGKYLESLGYYDPKTDPLTLKVDFEKSIKWLKVGAQPSDTVRSLFRRAGLMEKWHKMRMGIKDIDSEKATKKKVRKKAEPKEKEEVEIKPENHEEKPAEETQPEEKKVKVQVEPKKNKKELKTESEKKTD
jgi:small subunit ribosomal protein S16